MQPYYLFCLPHAGGSAMIYARWLETVDPAIKLVPLELPGRGTRFKDRPYPSIGPLVEELHRKVSAFVASGADYALFGHSMGALLAYELARRIAAGGEPKPRHLIVSGLKAPQLINRAWEPLSHLPDDELKARLAQMGGTPQAVLDNEELMELFLPVIRADFRLLDEYVHEPQVKLAVPVTVLTGNQDRMTEAEMQAWQELASGRFELHTFPGGHFYLADQTREVSECVSEALLGGRLQQWMWR
ncbi:thioesterase II family protein [Paenibacillus xanthanilyticus]|uniref:Thioesterase II family protein n=1 Tax=Paenibacillus xanthanilyticus TaxID=1783531 RepID=A0ABV8JYG0_9BACL